MTNNYILGLITVYHGVFVLVFAGTAVLALGGMLGRGYFSGMKDTYLKLLVGILIAELATAVITTYTTLPKLEIARAEEYAFELTYRDYLKDWIRAQSEQLQRRCFDNNKPKSKAPHDCRQKILEFERQAPVINRTGEGRMFLALDRGRYSGLVSYEFPESKTPTIFDISGHVVDKDTFVLRFNQNISLIANATCSAHERPAMQFLIKFSLKDRSGRFVGLLHHPSYTVDNKLLVLAEAKLQRL